MARQEQQLLQLPQQLSLPQESQQQQSKSQQQKEERGQQRPAAAVLCVSCGGLCAKDKGHVEALAIVGGAKRPPGEIKTFGTPRSERTATGANKHRGDTPWIVLRAVCWTQARRVVAGRKLQNESKCVKFR